MNNNRIHLLIAAFIISFYQLSLSKEAIKQVQNGIQVETIGQNLKIQFYANNLIRIVKWLPETTPDSSSLVVIQKILPKLNLHD